MGLGVTRYLQELNADTDSLGKGRGKQGRVRHVLVPEEGGLRVGGGRVHDKELWKC